MTRLSLAFSPCPNDTFMFHALLHGLVDTGGLEYAAHLHDIDELNEFAFSGLFDVTKMSFFAYLKLQDNYRLLDAGAALGFGCGPLLVARNLEAFSPDATIAIPGEMTTASLLLQLWNPGIHHTVVTRFDDILPGVARGVYDAGLIIHEGRFVYQNYGCRKIVDLGQWWEEETGLPIPLGCIAVKKASPAMDHREAIQTDIRQSIQYAVNHPETSRDFIRKHAQEMDDQVIDGHIQLYVNPFSLELGEVGEAAICKLEEMALWADIL
ncbi:MAG: 1,4-dihydroxy-6-naphthoate synthase [Thermodesulfobacteriota bacterium]